MISHGKLLAYTAHSRAALKSNQTVAYRKLPRSFVGILLDMRLIERSLSQLKIKFIFSNLSSLFNPNFRRQLMERKQREPYQWEDPADFFPDYEEYSQEVWVEVPLHSKPVKELSEQESYDVWDVVNTQVHGLEHKLRETLAMLKDKKNKLFEIEMHQTSRGWRQPQQ
jgi:hypothetical protein